MNVKVIGAVCIIFGCGAWGFLLAAQHLQVIRLHQNLISVLNFMQCELQYRCTALPVLCRQAGIQSSGKIKKVLFAFADELEAQISPDAERCMASVLERCTDLPKTVASRFKALGSSLGKFDLQGQVRCLEAVREECRSCLEDLMHHKDARLRCYQTLGLCAGAAIAILFV